MASDRNRFLRRAGELIPVTLVRIVLLACAVSVLCPVVWTFYTSFKSNKEFFANVWALPETLHWENYVAAWTTARFGSYFFNSFFVVVLTWAMMIVMTSVTAYAIAKFNNVFTRFLERFYIVAMAIPQVLVLLPLFFMASSLHMTIRWCGCRCSTRCRASRITSTIRISIRNVSGALVEAGIIDGATEFGVFFRIVLPVCKPPLFVVSLMSIMGTWNEYITALTFITDPSKYTVAHRRELSGQRHEVQRRLRPAVRRPHAGHRAHSHPVLHLPETAPGGPVLHGGNERVTRMSEAPNEREFRQPPGEYGPVPFWFWNDGLDIPSLLWQLDEMRDKGISSCIIHARKGLGPGYLSEKWFDAVGAVLNRAAQTGMRVWIYDEDNWPSGYAGGRVARENPDFAARCLTREKIYPVLGKTLTVPERPGTRLAGVVAAYENRRFVDLLDPLTGRVKEWAPQTLRWEVHVFREQTCAHRPAYSDLPYTDLLNPKAVSCFVRVTHAEYKRRFPQHWGKTLVGFFTTSRAFIRTTSIRRPTSAPSRGRPIFRSASPRSSTTSSCPCCARSGRTWASCRARRAATTTKCSQNSTSRATSAPSATSARPTACSAWATSTRRNPCATPSRWRATSSRRCACSMSPASTASTARSRA